MTYADVEGKSAEELRLMRNYIFARRGYIFESEDLKEYFEQFSWYVPLYYDVTPRLSDIEKYNVNIIKEWETNFGPDYNPEYEYYPTKITTKNIRAPRPQASALYFFPKS